MRYRNKVGNLWDWEASRGSRSFVFDDLGGRKLRFEIITEGASVFLDETGAEAPVLIAAGQGAFLLEVSVHTGGRVLVDPEHENADSSVRFEASGVDLPIGWVDGHSFTDLEPKRLGQVAPEVQAMFDLLQRNMLQREAVLQAQIDVARRNPP